MAPGRQTAEEAMRPLVVVCALYVVLNVFFVTLRFVSRFSIRRSETGWDDWLIIPAFVCNIGACACGLGIAHYESIGNKSATLPLIQPEEIHTQLEPTLKLVYASIFLLILGFTFPKLSILTLYLRIFTGRKTRLVTYLLMGFVSTMAVAFILAGSLLCTPTPYFWDRTIVGGQCMDINFYFRSFGIPNILVDVAMLITPLPAIWSLEASVARRVGISAVFLTGITAMVASCIRWAIFANADASVVVPVTNARLFYVNIIECSTYLIAACLPASYPAFYALIPRRVRAHFHSLSSKLNINNQPDQAKPLYPPAVRRLSPQSPSPSEKAYQGSFSKLVESPRTWSPVPPRPDSRTARLSVRASREQLAPKESMQLTRNLEVAEDKASMSTHGRSQSRAETVRREDDDEQAMAELRRLASEHKVPMPHGGENGMIAVHTEIEVTQEEGIDAMMDK